MASIRRKSSSLKWYACITLPNGKQKQFSTGLEDENEARAVATMAERNAGKQTSPHQLRAALERLTMEFMPTEDAKPSEWLKSWLITRKPEVEASTYTKYSCAITTASDWFDAQRIHGFAQITTKSILELRNQWSESLSPATTNINTKILRMAFKTAVKERRIDHNPAEDVARIKEPETARREFRAAELDILLPSLSGEWKAMVFLGLYTGQRLNDLAELRWKNLDLAAKTIAFTTKKTHAVIALPLMQPAIDALTEIPSSDSPEAFIFPNIAKIKKPARSNAFRRILARVGLARGLKEKSTALKNRDTSELSFHSFRHTATTMLKSAGVSDAIARAIIGHESVSISRSYTHLDLNTMREAMEKMPNR